ncbi:hypothetical protein ACOSQ2_022310 [Xanthoceras sorbifolium]
MLDFGEELTIDTYKIPWLIWIQILVLLLLLILLYCFSAFSLDLSHDNSNTTSSLASSSSSAPSSNLTHQSLTSNEPLLIKRSSQPSQVGGSQSIKGEILSTTARGTIRRRRVVGSGDQEATTTTDNNQRERESASSTSTSTAINYHPCHYFKLARLAFLKCLGLDSSSENSSTPNEQRKER